MLALVHESPSVLQAASAWQGSLSNFDHFNVYFEHEPGRRSATKLRRLHALAARAAARSFSDKGDTVKRLRATRAVNAFDLTIPAASVALRLCRVVPLHPFTEGRSEALPGINFDVRSCAHLGHSSDAEPCPLRAKTEVAALPTRAAVKPESPCLLCGPLRFRNGRTSILFPSGLGVHPRCLGPHKRVPAHCGPTSPNRLRLRRSPARSRATARQDRARGALHHRAG